MKITLKRNAILNALKRVAAVAPSSHLMPILSHLLCEVDNGVLHVTGYDLEMSLTASIEAACEGSARFTLPAKKFVALLSGFGGDPDVILEVNGVKTTLRVGRSRFVMHGLPAQDFPALACKAERSFEMEAAQMSALLAHVRPCQAVKDIRYYLNGTHLEVEKGHMNAVATDGLRMGVMHARIDGVDGDMSIILPRPSSAVLGGIADEVGGTCMFRLGGGVFEAGMGHYTLVCKLVDAKFPDWRRVVPKDGNVVRIHKDDLVSVLRRHVVMDQGAGCCMTFAAGMLKVMTGKDDMADESLEIHGTVEGDTTIGLQIGQMLDAISVVAGAEVEIVYTGPQNAVQVRAVGAGSEAYTVVMPMRV